MRAVGVRNGKGDADALFIEENVADPVPKDDQLLVRVKAFGLNRMDTMQREGKYPFLPPDAGPIIGVEFSGTVESKGSACSDKFSIGDAVFGLISGGAYAEKVVISEGMLIPKPPHLTHEEAAGTTETCFTAFQALSFVGGFQSGQSVLVHAGASGVGQAAIQIAKLLGASKVFTTAGSDAKCKQSLELGADVAVNYRTEDFSKVVEKETNGRGVDLIIDLIGRDYWHKNMASAAPDGKLVLVSMMSGPIVDNLDLRVLLTKRLSIMATTLRIRDKEYKSRLCNAFIEQVLPHFEARRIRTIVDSVYPWTQVADAHKRMEQNLNSGKIICAID
ncbi:hypothetical protein ASPZODRAFT_133221 [Penicilliopsis zonata CBS 506.65]|uniref:Enoyl reductase (ER) domain-containing protein n=1 Tax=Penicilliopsis zonata CBS 506.65 TaxID=1073090 RepID=A0A1L9SGD0_9EURO|nr:hypothetical protein ASPZODRAFT_133221 [Penicilliopsis zonata CBS 506.65]OJJ46216.1 hypothetical protein ASPZODRAFT_133221 [Penicilliopsis zonata CBS 506.65]